MLRWRSPRPSRGRSLFRRPVACRPPRARPAPDRLERFVHGHPAALGIDAVCPGTSNLVQLAADSTRFRFQTTRAVGGRLGLCGKLVNQWAAATRFSSASFPPTGRTGCGETVPHAPPVLGHRVKVVHHIDQPTVPIFASQFGTRPPLPAREARDAGRTARLRSPIPPGLP